jgi:hypothetical protein
MKAAPLYKDFWVKIIGSLIASQIIDALNREESYVQRFTTSYFYTDLLGGFAIALLLWEIVRRITRYLDRQYSWIEQPVQRLALQVGLGIFLPSLLSFFLTFAFMRLAYNQDIFQTTWLYNEFYTVILIIVLVNLVYFTWWLYLYRQEQPIAPISDVQPLTTEAFQPEAQLFATPSPDPTIEVTKAGKTILLPYQQVAYAYLNDSYCYIKSWEGDNYVTTYTLDEVSRMLDGCPFFRANRQILISRKACVAYQSIENGKIELDLNPGFKSPVVVSQKRARDFRKWVSNGQN